MRFRFGALVALVVATAMTMSGCVAGDFGGEASGGVNGDTAGGEASASSGTCVSFSAGGATSTTKEFESPSGKAQLSLSVGGAGSVTVRDGGGKEVFSDSWSGGYSASETLSGSSGTWTIKLNAGGGVSGNICGS